MNKNQIIKNTILGAREITKINDQVSEILQCGELDRLFQVSDYFLDIILNTLELPDSFERDEFVDRYFAVTLDFKNEFEDIEKALVYLLLEG